MQGGPKRPPDLRRLTSAPSEPNHVELGRQACKVAQNGTKEEREGVHQSRIVGDRPLTDDEAEAWPGGRSESGRTGGVPPARLVNQVLLG
nr:hypothetical protein Iba_chr14eCG4590 [Ipomoea batatas]